MPLAGRCVLIWSYPALDAVAEFYAAKAAKDDDRVVARGVSLSQA